MPSEAPSFLWPSPNWWPTLEVDEVHVWATPLDLPLATVRDLEPLLSAEEVDRAKRFRGEIDRHRFVAARVTLRCVLASYRRSHPSELRIEVAENGKPALADEYGPRALRFNLSHTEGLALIAVTLGREIGVDVERIRPIAELEAIVEMHFTARERDALRLMDNDARLAAFYRCWTRKESYVKASGNSLSVALRDFDTLLSPTTGHVSDNESHRSCGWNLHELAPAEGYVGAVALEGPAGRLFSWRWTSGRQLAKVRRQLALQPLSQVP